MVGVTKIQRGNAGYWLAAVAEGGEDYYTKPGEAPGEWIGELATELELFGQVDPASYTAILEGRNPRDGKPFLKRPGTRFRKLPDGREKRVEPVLGYDIRFSAPKSVSILYALGDEETRARVLKVLHKAVRDGLAHLEREACMVQRGEGGARIERGRGFVGMAFRHRMSRAGDPALHVHVVISNLTRARSDGKWLSLAAPRGRSPLWTHAKSAGVVFQASLRAGFQREFGLDFEEVRNGWADLQGFGREVIEALSTRSKEIAGWLESHGVEGARAAQVAAYRTREAKDHGLDEDERRAEWIETAAPFEVTPESLGEMVAEANPREPRAVCEADLDAAIAKLEETRSHFDRRELLWAICDQLPEGADPASLTAAVDAVLRSERVVCLHEAAGPLDLDHYTTPRLAELERRFIEGAIEGVDAGAAQVSAPAVEAVLARHPRLGKDQLAMVRRLVSGGEEVIAVAAWPGTGKTTALEAAREAWLEAGFPVIGCATARTASAELKAVGVPSTSVCRLLEGTDELRARGIMPLARGTVILLDEASTTSTLELAALRLLAVECEGKLVPIGDPFQIGAVGPGGLYGHFTRVSEPITLTTIRRQHHEADSRLVALIHEGRGSEALDQLRARGRLIVGEDLPSTLDGMLADWYRDYAGGADVVMIARRNRDVDYLNDSARERRREAGALGEAEVIVGERPFAAGDRVLTRINREGAVNRERWDVLQADSRSRTLRLRRLGDGHTLTLGPRYLDRRRDDRGPALEYAYALTKFGAQGKTVDRAYPLLDPGADLEQELVALSRGREFAYAYAVASSELLDPDLGPARREISDELHDIRAAIEREGNDFAAIEFGAREKVGRMSDAELAARRAELVAAMRDADPLLDRHERLQHAVAHHEARAEHMRFERECLEAMPAPLAEELRRVGAGETRIAEALERERAELKALAARGPSAEQRPLDPALRLEASLVERRIEHLARADIEAERLEPTPLFYSVLGTYPKDDPEKALAWHEGAHALAAYRRRYDVRDVSEPLGDRPRSASQRVEHEAARRRIETTQRRLGQEVGRGRRRVVEIGPEVGR